MSHNAAMAIRNKNSVLKELIKFEGDDGSGDSLDLDDNVPKANLLSSSSESSIPVVMAKQRSNGVGLQKLIIKQCTEEGLDSSEISLYPRTIKAGDLRMGGGPDIQVTSIDNSRNRKSQVVR